MDKIPTRYAQNGENIQFLNNVNNHPILFILI